MIPALLCPLIPYIGCSIMPSILSPAYALNGSSLLAANDEGVWMNGVKPDEGGGAMRGARGASL